MPHHKKALPPKGFTLLELCVVCSLIILISSYAGSCLLRVPHSAVHLEIKRLYRVITYLRKKAVLLEKRYSITFAQDGRSYTADRTWYFPSNVRIDDSFDQCRPPSSTELHTNHTITWKRRRIDISSQGTVSAGAIYLTDSKRTAFYALTADASEISGIRIYTWKDGWNLID